MTFFPYDPTMRPVARMVCCVLLSLALAFGLLPTGAIAQPVVDDQLNQPVAAEQSAVSQSDGTNLPTAGQSDAIDQPAPAGQSDAPDSQSGTQAQGADVRSVTQTAALFEAVDESELADDPLLVVYKDAPMAIDQDLDVDTEALPDEVVESIPLPDSSVAMEDVGVVSQQEVADQLPDCGAITSVSLEEGASLSQAAAVLEASDAVDYVAPNYALQLFDTTVDDPYANANPSSYTSQYYLGAINAFKAWDLAKGENNVTVAVVDSGVYAKHADLASVVDTANAFDATTENGGTFDMTRDPVRHGTAVCGILSAQANNGIGMAGASYNAKVLPIRTFEDDGSGSTAYVVRAYGYMLANYEQFDNLRVVNLSLGYYPNEAGIAAVQAGCDPMYNAINALREKHGVVTVAAGGNGVNGVPQTGVSYPSDYDICIGVAAVDRNMQEVKSFDYNEYKDVSAPGASILHPTPSGVTAYESGGGTSYASPMVAAAAALLCVYKPSITPDQVQDVLESTAVPVSGQRVGNGSAGVIDMYAALESLSVYDMTLPASSFTYTGSAIRPVPTVKRQGQSLREGVDYRLTYMNNVNAGTATVRASGGSGEQAWQRERTFRILPCNLMNVTVSSIPTQRYTGQALQPKPKVTHNGKTLKEGTDYALSYANNRLEGTAQVVISGMGNYTGTRTVSFSIVVGALGKATISGVNARYAYTGSAICPVPLVRLDGALLKNGTDYRVTYSGNVNAGTAVMTITGLGVVEGTRRVTFTIDKKSLGVAAVALSPGAYTYDGTAKRPKIAVSLSGKALKAGTDYTASYKNNVKPGTATVTVTGKGNYAGTVTKSFKIAKASLAKATVSVASTLPYSGKALRPAVTVKLAGKTLKAGTDYTVAYKNNVGSAKAGSTAKATVTVTGKGSYTGAVSKAFQVKTPSVQYHVHRQTYGWEAKYSKRDGASSGTTGQRKRLEGIYVRLANKPVSGSIQYRTHVQKQGWEKGWRSEGQMSGTTGKRYRLEAIQIRLTGEMAKRYDVYYRVHAQKLGWMGWAKNGASAGTAGYAYRLESIQIKLVPKGGAAPTSAGGVASTKGKAAFSQKR